MSGPLQAFDGAVSRIVQGVMSGPASLESEVDRFQVAREKTLGILRQLSQTQAMWQPRRETWSIAQNTDHLLRSEELYREQFARLLQMAREARGTTVTISLREVDSSLAAIPREVAQFFEVPIRMFNVFVPHVFRETLIRYPLLAATNPKVSEPRFGLTIAKLRNDLSASLAETLKLFHQPMPSNVDRLRIDHPILGNNSLVQMMRIMTAHEERHQGQMTNIVTSASFPRV